MTLQQVHAIFVLADIAVLRVWKLPNGYLGDLEPLTDEEIVNDMPGQLGVTEQGGRVEMPGITIMGQPTRQQSSGVVRNWMADYRWRYARPAWLVKTDFGLIQITERKRVIELDWWGTHVRQIITTDDTTKDLAMVHAWSEEKLLEYLKALGRIEPKTVADLHYDRDR